MSEQILSAVRDLCADMVAPPLEQFKAGDVIISKCGNRYRLRKARGAKDLFQLQSMSNLQVGYTKWTARQLEIAGVRKV